MIGGPMGVGKSTVSRILRDRLDNSVLLDGDWCWDMHPFRVTAARSCKMWYSAGCCTNRPS